MAFRRLSLRRRSTKERRKSLSSEIRNADDASPRPSHPCTSGRTRLNEVDHTDIGEPCATAIDAYEERIDELGRMMQEQGRCIDGLTERSRRVSTENTTLRERLSSRLSCEPAARKPGGQGASEDGDAAPTRKLRDDNALLLEQADLLAAELRDANARLAEGEERISALGKELATCLEKARAREKPRTCPSFETLAPRRRR